MSLTDAERQMVGGSDMAALLGDSTWSTPFQVYARIVGAPQPEQQKGYQRRGHMLERAVLELYAEEQKVTLLPGPKLTHPRLGYVRCSLDGLGSKAGAAHVVDAKTLAASERRHFGEPGTDQVRRDILYQMTLYIGVGLARGVVQNPWADVPVLGLSGADLTVYRVGFDAELFGLLEEAAERFWRDFVLPRRPPLMTEPTGDLEAVGRLYPSHSGDALQWDSLPPDGQQAVCDWLRAQTRLKRAQLRADGCEALVKMAFGTAPQLVGLPEHLPAHRVDWKQTKERTAPDWQAVAERLRAELHVSPGQFAEILKDSTTTKPGPRPIRAYERTKR